MLIIGCDFHPVFQQVAIFDNQTGEYQEPRLQQREEAEQFYRSLAVQEVRVGMEACGHYPWFEPLLAELGFVLWLEMRPRSGPRWCVSKRRTGETRNRYSPYCGRIGFRGSGCLVWRSGTYGSCWCIATSKCRLVP